MNQFKNAFNSFGEFKNTQQEQEFLNHNWENNKKLYLGAYFICCTLLMFAGFIDYKRNFYFGNANLLMVLRGFLFLGGLGFYFRFRKETEFKKSFNFWGFLLSVYSSAIIVALNAMTNGESKTMLPGILIITISYYVVLYNRLFLAMIPALMQAVNFIFFYDSDALGLGAHEYMSFLLVVINFILMSFKFTWNKTTRSNFQLAMVHREMADTKNKILGIIGHDLRNPLFVISLKSSLGRKRIQDNNIEGANKAFDDIEAATFNINKMLHDLINWAIHNSDRPEMINKSVKETLESAIKQSQQVADQKEIILNNEIKDLEFDHNPNVIETIARNIIVNAIKYSPSKSQIHIHGKQLDNVYQISIKDEGMGMDETIIKNVLNGENKKSTNGTKGEKGSGLGLKLVHDLVKSHDGELEIESKENTGTNFTVNLKLSA